MKKTTIAIIDKQYLFRMALKSLINQEAAFEVVQEAGNGQDFINQMNRNHPPDLVLLDTELPVLNGFDTIRWLREQQPRVRVIVLSDTCDDESVLKAIRLGARGYLPKSAGFEELKTTISSIMNRGYYLTDPISDKLLQTLQESTVEFEHVSPVSTLSEKMVTFLRYCCTDMTYKEIASKMGISHRTVDSYRDHLFEKLQVKNRVGLAIFALRNGLMDN